ncbi:MAG: diguanylate cyclase domain-containing protein [Methylovirgula sp.]
MIQWKSPRTALNVASVGFALFFVLAIFSFLHITYTLEARHKAEFMAFADAKQSDFSRHFQELSALLFVTAELPAFRHMRFSELTLDTAAVRHSIRELELFFVDAQRREEYFNAVRFIGNDGSEIFKVENATIGVNLGDVSQDPQTILALGLKRGEMRVSYREIIGRKYLTWWIPVYSSLTHRQGVLAIDYDFALLKHRVGELYRAGFMYPVVSDAAGHVILQYPDMPAGIAANTKSWSVSFIPPLPGLDWRVGIYGDVAKSLRDVTTIRRIILFGLVPLSVLLFAMLWRVGILMEAERKSRYAAHHDMLTGLPNRTLLRDRLDQAIAVAKRDQTCLALLFIDLDKFKAVNDTFGHEVGDLLLSEVAKRISLCLRQSDSACRIGGDEFVVLLPNIKTVEYALQVANKIHAVLARPFNPGGHKSHISASTGIALFPKHADDAESLVKNADSAMYHAKQNGRGNVQFYQPEQAVAS